MAISTAVDASAVARVTGIKTTFKDLKVGAATLLPQMGAIVGQGATSATYSTDKAQHTSALSVANTYGYGSPLHLAALQIFPLNGDGVGTIPMTFYPLEDDGSGVAAAGDITPSGPATGSASFVVRINNIDSEQFVVSSGDSVATIITSMFTAIAAELDLPMTAVDNTTVLDLTAKWAGASSNDLYIEVVATSEDNSGITFGITQPTGGLVNPDVQPALDQVGNVWETMFLNCMEIADTTTLDAFANFNEGRWGALSHKPSVTFTGNSAEDVNTATTVSDSRKTDRSNSQLVAPGSKDLPFVIAARQMARIITLANNVPAHDYGRRQATGLTPGADGVQWDYADKDSAVKKGSSTIDSIDGVVSISDVVTFYHPSGDPLPAYRYVVDIVKIQNILFNIDIEFSKAEWDGAPLLPDDQPSAEPTVKRPRMAKAAMANIIDGLALAAIISDPETAKESILAEIDSSNPKRLNLSATFQISGNSNIKSIDLNWGFFFGTPTIV